MISLKKNLSVLGSTGSIGTQTLDVARELGIKISSLSANKNISLLEKQIREFKPDTAAVFDEKFAKELKQKVKDTSTKILSGTDGLCEAACCKSVDCVVTAVSGMIGLKPTIAAIKAKKRHCSGKQRNTCCRREFGNVSCFKTRRKNSSG